jgi:hypothetical protein
MASSLARRLDPYATIELRPSPRGNDKLATEPALEADTRESSAINLRDYTSAGYYLSRRTGVTDCGIDLGRVSLASNRPERAFFPDSWALSWVPREKEERAARAAVFGFGEDQVESIVDWASRSFGRSFGFWRVFFSIEDARSVGQSALGGIPDMELWGVGLHRTLFDSYRRAPAQFGASGVRTAVYARTELAEGGVPLGYDILLEESGSSFSNPESRGADEVAMFRSTGVAPNDDGLIDSFDDARKCCRYLDERPAAARVQVKGWLPWLLVRYSLD